MTEPSRPQTDPTVAQRGNRDGADGHYSGQEPGSFDSPSPATVDAGALRGGAGAVAGEGAGAGHAATNLPPEAGHRATVDQRTGEVHGSGTGAGGGQAGEDPDDDTGGSNVER